MSDISAWLTKLELAQYVGAFADNDITFDLLPDIDHDLLKDIGVASAGHRLKILKAVKLLATEAEKGDRRGQPDDVTTPVRNDASRAQAERRQITVMFCDLVGSTALSEQLDPEDLRTLMQAYQQTAGRVIERYEGHVAQYLGDGLMTYFGWPQAHENDAERAVRAGLEILEAVKEVDAPSPLQVRVGIATGPVVVGETGAGDASVPKLAVGETPNVAARLQALASPDQIVIAPSTHRLTAGAFDYENLGERTLKGVVEPMRAWQVVGRSRVEGRFEAQTEGDVIPLVGRESELSMFMERWEQAKEGEGQVILLSGEPGIGKSRLAQDLAESLKDEPHMRLGYQCSPYYTNTAFYPIIDQLERAAGFVREDGQDDKLDKLETLLEQSSDDAKSIAPLFAAVLSLPADRYPPLNLSPQAQKDHTITAIANQLAGLARQRPVLMLFEDAHWCDPTSLDTLGALIDRLRDLPVLLVITYRPEFSPPWFGHSHVTIHSLNRLSRRYGADMVAEVTGGKALPDDVLDQIVSKTDGVPLFVEELTKLVLEAGFLKEDKDRYVLDGPLPSLAIPATLQGSLMARLDRLGPHKELVQIGAAVGRSFSYELLAEVAQLDENEFQEALSQLVMSGLLHQQGQGPDATFVFKHALVQDVAYESLLKSKRQRIHADIARALEARFSDLVESAPELLAHHYSEAGLAEPAVNHWLSAGRRATEHSADNEAVAHFQAGLAQLTRLAESRRRDELELDLQMAIGMSRIATAGPDSPGIEEAFSRSRTLSEKLEEPGRFLTAMWGHAIAMYIKGEIARTVDLGVEVFRSAEQLGDEAMTIVGLRGLGTLEQMMGNFTSARDHLEAAIRLYRPEDHRPLSLTHGHDPLVAGQSILSVVDWALGHPDQAMRLSRESVAYAKEIGHTHTLALALSYAAWIRYFLNDASALQEIAEELISLSGEHHFPVWHATAIALRGSAIASRGAPEEGEALIREGLENYRALGGVLTLPFLVSLLAGAEAQADKIDAALLRIYEALSIAREGDEHWWISDLLRRRGEWLVASTGAIEQAEECLGNAIDTAKKQQAKAFELRAATSLARIWTDAGRKQEARDLLLPVYSWFSEGFDTHDLIEAKALLGDLE